MKRKMEQQELPHHKLPKQKVPQHKLHLFSSILQPKVTFMPLSQCKQYLRLAATWAEDEWGYIRRKGVDFREEVLEKLSDQVYIGTYGGIPVTMFALLNHEYCKELQTNTGPDQLPNALALMYVYVDENWRGVGFGRAILKEARRLASTAGADFIILDTLKTPLNRMYLKQGAELVCENHLFSQPTDVLTMRI